MKLVTPAEVRAAAAHRILIHTSVKLVTFAEGHLHCRRKILIHTSVKLVTAHVMVAARYIAIF